MCQSVARPSSAEYWHMGAMAMRLESWRGPSEMGEKRWVTAGFLDVKVPVYPFSMGTGAAGACPLFDFYDENGDRHRFRMRKPPVPNGVKLSIQPRFFFL